MRGGKLGPAIRETLTGLVEDMVDARIEISRRAPLFQQVRAFVKLPFLWLPIFLVMYACSAVMEARRPEPVDFSDFQPGRSRDSVVEEIGGPEATLDDQAGDSCDSYHLYTRGPSGLAKFSLELFEGGAAIVTLGISDIAMVPAEYGIKSKKHAVSLCYREERLVSITSDGPTHHSFGAVAAKNLASLDSALKAEIRCEDPEEVGHVTAIYVVVEAKSPGPLRIDAPVAIKESKEIAYAVDLDTAINEAGGDAELASQLKHLPSEALLTPTSAVMGTLELASLSPLLGPLAPWVVYNAIKDRHRIALQVGMAIFPVTTDRTLKMGGYMFFPRQDYKAVGVTVGDAKSASHGRISSAQCSLQLKSIGVSN